jgi:hypothetical protein
MVFSASIVLTLGILHLVSTFWGPSLTPRDPALEIGRCVRRRWKCGLTA